MLQKDELLAMIDHCLHYSGESYAADFYEKYRDIVRKSLLSSEEKAACDRVLEDLINGSVEHLEVLRKLKGTVERDERGLY